jgi:uncharacterized protein YjbI with pentapeptide repeats
VRPIAPPRLAAVLEPAGDPALPVLVDEAVHHGLDLAGADLGRASATDVEFTACRFAGTDLVGVTLRRAAFTDCRFLRGDLANLTAQRSSMRRVALELVRLTGVQWLDGVLRDVTITECRADLAAFRFTRFAGVAFERCNLARADFQNADLTGVRFTDCNLAGAQFSHATMDGTRFANCDLDGVGGVTSFRGSIVTGHDLIALSRTLAAALGIAIEP